MTWNGRSTKGDVDGPIVSTDGNITGFDGATGTKIKDLAIAPSTDGTFAANSDAKIPTEKAVKTYVASQQAADLAAYVPKSVYADVGSIPYGGSGSGSSVLNLVGNTAATKKFLSETGTGSAGQAPTWEPLVESDLPSKLRTQALAESVATALFQIALTAGQSYSGHIPYSINADDATDFQVHSGKVDIAAVNKAGTITAEVTKQADANDADAFSAGSAIVPAFTITDDTNAFTLKLEPTFVGISPTSIMANYRIFSDIDRAITEL